MLLRRSVCLCLFVLALLPAAGQELGVYVDTLSGRQPFVLRSFIRPGTEEIFHRGQKLDSTAYTIDYRFGRLLVPTIALEDTLTAYYRTWGLVLQDQYMRPIPRVAVLGADTSGRARPEFAEPPRRSRSLSRTGSITRGVLAGSNRDATIESGLRLQLAGMVADDVRVQAMLTDESTPILPEGTTQRLSELDRVYIEIESGPGLARLGDFSVAYNSGHFARLGRKVQGAGITIESPFSRIKGTTQVMGATSRGIFRRQRLEVVDGVQGPYRVTGEQNEPFIFIVPGSEELYLDGQRLQRGQTRDYVIDYATGEITFTTNRIIRSYDRVVAEYQYRTTEFTRTLMGASSDVVIGSRTDGPPRATLGMTFLRESDGRTISEAFGLSADDEVLLRVAGDSVAQRSGAITVPFDAEAAFVQYIRQDTLIGNTSHDIFVAVRRKPEEPVYRVSFTRVGPGEGSYVRQGRTTNGLVYEWRGPGSGDYVPVRILPKPREHRMIDFRAAAAPVRHLELYGEWARSLYDRNRLSPLHKEDDRSRAYAVGLRLTPVPVGAGSVAVSAHRRHTGAGFATFSRIRPVEFERLWNLNAQQTAAARRAFTEEHETIDEAEAQWQASPRSSLSFTAGRIALGRQFTARRGEATLQIDESGWPLLNYHMISIRSQDDALAEHGTWLRQRGRFALPVLGDRLTPGIRFIQEQRELRSLHADSLTAPSQAYIQITPGITWRAGDVEVGAAVDLRTEDRVFQGVLGNGGRSVTWDIHFDVAPAGILSTEGRMGVRRRTLPSDAAVPARDEQSAVVRWSGRWQPWQRMLQLHWFYEALSERTPALQEIYIRTGPELGEYVWVDANGNGVPELDEFLPEAMQDEGTYVRTLFPSDSLQSVISLQSRFSLHFEPARVWREGTTRMQRALRHLSLRTALNVQEKSRNPSLSDVYLLRLQTFRSPVHTLKGLLVLQQDLFLFAEAPRYGLDLTYRHVRGLNELAAGTESRATDEYRGEARLKVSSRWGAALSLASGRRRTSSESFPSRNFAIETHSMAPEVTYAASRNLQVSLTAFLARKNATGTRALLWKVPLDVRYARARRLNVTGRLEAASVSVRGDAYRTGLALFELTDGRGAGTSFMWTVSSWYQLSSVMRATLTYNGRRPQGAPTVHTVRMQLSAIF